MRVSIHDTWDTISEQMNLRYNRTYTVTRRGVAIRIQDIIVEAPRDEYDEVVEGEDPNILIRAVTKAGNSRTYQEHEVVWDMWPKHHVLFHHRWGGVMVWEKNTDRQIKKLPCDSSISLVGGAWLSHPFSADGYFDIVEAMRTPQYHDLATAKQLIEENKWMAVPISLNAYLDRQDRVWYHSLPLGTVEEAQVHPLWRIIQKEAAQ